MQNILNVVFDAGYVSNPETGKHSSAYNLNWELMEKLDSFDVLRRSGCETMPSPEAATQVTKHCK